MVNNDPEATGRAEEEGQEVEKQMGWRKIPRARRL